MARHLFIVSRQHPDLYVDLLERFADDKNVSVILDRRFDERRRTAISTPMERRRAERRTRPDTDEELRWRSHAVVTIL